MKVSVCRFDSYLSYYLGVLEWFNGTDSKSDDSWVQISPPSLKSLLPQSIDGECSGLLILRARFYS